MVTITNEPGDAVRATPANVRALGAREAGYSIAKKCLEVQTEFGSKDANGRHLLHPDAASWYQGTVGEIRVGQLLEKLGPDWLVLHSVPFGSAETDIDHLLVGPTGVFTINTKFHRNAHIWIVDSHLRVENRPQRHLDAARSEAQRVADRLAARLGFRPVVHSVLAMVDPRHITDKRRVNADPVVVDSRHLVDWLRRFEAKSEVTNLDQIRAVAEDPATWHDDADRVNAFRVMQRFERLYDDVGDPAPVIERAARAKAPVAAKPSRPKPALRPSTRVPRSPARPQSAVARVLLGIFVFFPLALVAFGIINGMSLAMILDALITSEGRPEPPVQSVVAMIVAVLGPLTGMGLGLMTPLLSAMLVVGGVALLSKRGPGALIVAAMMSAILGLGVSIAVTSGSASFLSAARTAFEMVVGPGVLLGLILLVSGALPLLLRERK